MLRIAYFSPLNPIPSGISDYSEDLLPYLAAYAEIDLFIDKGYRPANPDIRAHFPIYRYDRYPRTRRGGYDVTLYHVGNSPAHDYILSTLERYPGVVVMHDYILHHLVLWRAFRHGDGMAYHDAMVAYGEEAAWRLALRMMRGQHSQEAFHYPLCEATVAAAQAIIAHSTYVADRVRDLRPDVPLAVVPMGVPPPALPDREEARRRLDLPSDALVLTSFGHINPYKRVEPALRAYRSLRESHPGAFFVLVGSVSEHYDLPGLLRRLDLQEAVRVTGYADLGTFLGYMAASDICLNLRYPSAGETSASLLRLLGAGRPTLISRTAAFAEIPADVAIQVDVDDNEEEEILALLRYLADHPAARRTLGQNAQHYVATEHTLEEAAAGYAHFLGQLCGQPVPEKPPRPPLFLPQTGRPAPLPEAVPIPVTVEESPPLAVELVAKGLADIGMEEDDIASIRAVTETLAGLPELAEERKKDERERSRSSW